MSFILLGILNAQAEAGGAPVITSDYELLETTILDSSASSVSFTGLGSYTDYKHLQLRITGRTDSGTTGDGVLLNFNSDTGSNYAWHRLTGNGSSVSSLAGPSASSIPLTTATGGSESADQFGASVSDILDFSSSTKNTTVRTLAGVSSTFKAARLFSGLWNDTSAVTSIDLTPQTGTNLVAGSRLSLYGLKESV